MFFAVLLVLEKQGFSAFLQKHSLFSHMYVLLAVTVSFVIFNAVSTKDALETLKVMFSGGSLPLVSKEFLYYLKSYGVILTVSVVGATFAAQLIERFRTKKTAKQLLNILEPAVLIVLMLTVTAYLIQDSYNPFLYFRF